MFSFKISIIKSTCRQLYLLLAIGREVVMGLTVPLADV